VNTHHHLYQSLTRAVPAAQDALLAAGQVDLVIEAGLQSYDIQAPIAVIEAAGGIVTNWEGGPAKDGGRVIAAANTAVHAEALAILQDTLRG
jgi:myo-inositol-1(or 4)-monophosphatase